MKMMDVIGIVIGSYMLIHIIIFVRQNYGRIRKKRQCFENRPITYCGNIYETYFADSGLDPIDVRESWEELASTLKLDPQRLHPTDRFDRELGPVAGTTKLDELDVLDAVLACRCRRLGLRDADLESIETIADYVRFSCRMDKEVHCYGKAK